MSIALLEYNPKHYDTLPPVLQAGRKAEPSGAIEALESVIGNVFVKCGVDKELGIILLHNHFDLSPNPNLTNVVPAAWRFVKEGLAPYEFVYSNPDGGKPAPVLTVEKHGPFLAELLAVLKERKLMDVLGLVVLEDKDINSPPLVEIESGRSTIALDVDINPQPETDAWIHVVWQFGTKIGPSGQPVVFKKHKIAHKIIDGSHGDKHLTTSQ